MGAFNIFLADTTNQNSRYDKFDGQEYNTIVTQQDGRTGPRDAQVMFGVGFASMPVENDRLMVIERNSHLYAIGGASQGVEESLGLSPGDRAVFSTDLLGAVTSLIHVKNDSTIEISAVAATTDGNLIVEGDTDVDGSLQVDTNAKIGTGTPGVDADSVALAGDLDLYLALVDTVLRAVDPLIGGIYATAMTALFPPSGTLPSMAATNLVAGKSTL